MDFSPPTIRARFHELTAAHDAIQLELDPLRAELDEIVTGDLPLTVREAREREEEIRPRIKELQEQLYPIEMERALCARALDGKTGSPE
jgi:hypothetical protein